LSLIMLALAVSGAVLCFARLRSNNAELATARGQVEQMNEEIGRLKGEGEKVRQQLSPDEQNLLIASHKLIDNKKFSWSRLFADLENVLPGSVSASRISVQNVYRDGDRVKAELDLGVLSRDYESVMSMITQMNNSGLFQAELRGQDRQQNQSTTYTEYSLHLIYMPAYLAAPAVASDVAQNAAQ
jgi:Tfp pilus assembly protein PilN